jgi:hypothetical protein
MIMFV